MNAAAAAAGCIHFFLWNNVCFHFVCENFSSYCQYKYVYNFVAVVVVKSLHSFELSVYDLRACLYVYVCTQYLRPLIATKIKKKYVDTMTWLRFSLCHSTHHNRTLSSTTHLTYVYVFTFTISSCRSYTFILPSILLFSASSSLHFTSAFSHNIILLFLFLQRFIARILHSVS